MTAKEKLEALRRQSPLPVFGALPEWCCRAAHRGTCESPGNCFSHNSRPDTRSRTYTSPKYRGPGLFPARHTSSRQEARIIRRIDRAIRVAWRFWGALASADTARQQCQWTGELLPDGVQLHVVPSIVRTGNGFRPLPVAGIGGAAADRVNRGFAYDAACARAAERPAIAGAARRSS